MSRASAERRGRLGEIRAAWYLRVRGYRILDRRVRTPRGEIDLVAKRSGLIVFVEVKTRATQAELDLAIDEYRLARVAAAAEILAPEYARKGEDIRIDVILIAPGHKVRHIENAWMG
ncbi:YraN family protein [Parasphingopyxis sp. CP4]|uniref:YraN family protein n=1 Tax=Parasphingopyxis sp. CP4 TaxID=2724527 RepID=UPI0015A2B173|nr:YraN family protein [Parasphingopyxis sp. CP4]QLC21106.1 YraN family protein [Parasphingopyxis sp. CP4]